MSKRYIDTDKLMADMYHRAFETDGDTMWQSGCWVRYRAIEQVVKAQPTADVVERKRGKWVNAKPRSGKVGLICSACENEAYWDSDYGQQEFNWCPYCGAMMERSEDGETD